MANTAWTFCTSAAAVAKAGANVSSVSSTAVTMADWCIEAQGTIEVQTGKSYIDNWSSLPAGTSSALADVCSSMVAMKLIAYDTTGYLSREADTLMNMNNDIIVKGMKDLEDFKKIKLRNPTG